METVKITVKSAETASRLELFIRFIYGLVACIVIGIIGIFAYLAWFVQWLHILLLGKRNAALAKFMNAWLVAYTQLEFYTFLSTDERPPIVPEF
ncbi:MAG: DUF4389 domain-containing protein [Candidatus Omnitrophica bacterium]|nr:DUF4389 domain-containing protein [Candidatus Omnitrophota bacterium]